SFWNILAIGLLLWFGPLPLIWLYLGSDSVYLDVRIFFSQTAVVTFGELCGAGLPGHCLMSLTRTGDDGRFTN
ncbi:MAG: hypothetical protein R3264_02945, partial [Anaerolineae bacterium]|nr:hypothetical protein [Anaerolineae bacterium]